MMLKNVLSKSRTFMMMPRPFAQFSVAQTYENILVDRNDEGVAIVTLNRPKALNALNYAMFQDLNTALK